MHYMQRVSEFWNRAREDRLPLLVAAAIIVGVAIAMGGDARRFVNGVGGVVWLVAGFLIVTRAVASGVSLRQVGQVAFVIVILSYLIRPTDPFWAAIGFGWGGVAVGFNGRDLGSKMGAMLGALWLPTHLLLAVARAVVRNIRDEPAALRSDPPPTAALVPLIMVVAAWMLATLTAEWRARQDDAQKLHTRRSMRVSKGQSAPGAAQDIVDLT
jgi:hypothetical protein